MNFIASVLISVTDSEKQGFIIFMNLLINKEMKPLFLPVSINIIIIKFSLFERDKNLTSMSV